MMAYSLYAQHIFAACLLLAPQAKSWLPPSHLINMHALRVSQSSLGRDVRAFCRWWIYRRAPRGRRWRKSGCQPEPVPCRKNNRLWSTGFHSNLISTASESIAFSWRKSTTSHITSNSVLARWFNQKQNLYYR